MELYHGSHYDLCRKALDKTPIHFAGIAYKAHLKAVYDLEVQGLYSLSIEYGPYALHAMVCIYDPDMSLYFDYQSMMVAIHCTVDMLARMPRTKER